ncbi:MAG: hypothetical protein J6W83_01370 [Bacteroidales bacterium]|nr:hypothetical protein [Bacteroidales bacterium]
MEEKPKKKRDSVGMGLYLMYLACLAGSLLLVGRLAYIQFFFKPDPVIERALTPQSEKVTIDPDRGAILARDGRMLAMTVPSYEVRMDCTTQPNAEEEWQQKARGLAEGLARILKDKTADQYYRLISEGRKKRNGYLRICSDINHDTCNRLAELPLFNEGQYRGGFITVRRMVRVYPYGKLARRTIGFVRDNNSTVGNRNVGLEGKFDYRLHGKEGEQYVRVIDNRSRVREYSRRSRAAEDGLDIRTTLDIDIQDIADAALRSQIEAEDDIEGGCLVVMDVQSGAIRAMVNLLRDTTSHTLEEYQNLAIGRRGEPGSVFKTVTLTSVLSDGYIKSLEEKLPTNHGVVKNARLVPDVHISDYERENKTREISVLDGFKMSSNYVFATLAVENYGADPQKYIDNIYLYKLGEAFDFDLEGLRTPEIPSPGSAAWSGNTTLGSIGFGYSTGETPLHILTFYNALANKGRMMRPYLVEAVEQHGLVVDRMGPGVLNASICSRAVADTVTRALSKVTEEGTARRLRNAALPVAGKTGTSFATFDTNADPKNPYVDRQGRRKYQGTFVGFFPTDDPRYSVICTVYSKPTRKSFQGGGLPAQAVKELVDRIWSIDPYWNGSLEKTAKLVKMEPAMPEIREGEVPDVRGLGIKDAVYAIENAGFRCTYTGIGHVASQQLDGKTVKLVLK